MGKFIALDIGEKRIGIARGEGSFAFASITLNVDENIDTEIEKVIQDEKPEKIVIGLPRNMDGTLGFQAEKVEEFVKNHLEKYESMLEYEDESVTSVEAVEMMKIEGKDLKKDKDLIDAYAAKIILESYIRRQP